MSLYRNIILLLLLGCSSLFTMGQDNVRPQHWNNIFVGYDFNTEFAIRSNVSFNTLLSNEIKWSELTFSATGVYTFHRIMEADLGLYVASANQSKELRSNEFRPYVGFRLFSKNERRWVVNNFSRLEFRFFRYSDATRDEALRFRNRTYFVVSTNKPTVISDRNFMVFAYYELFYNFEQEVRERFFNLQKVKLGFAYRQNFSWRFNLGFIYQDAVDNVTEPAQLPGDADIQWDTRWVLEWGVVYIIPHRSDT